MNSSKYLSTSSVAAKVEGFFLDRHRAAIELDLLRVFKRTSCVGRCNEVIVGGVEMRRDELTDGGRRACTWFKPENSKEIIPKERAVK